ncbi:MAG: PEGA domain-containing protein, partial [Cytophagaceae bacterium]
MKALVLTGAALLALVAPAWAQSAQLLHVEAHQPGIHFLGNQDLPGAGVFLDGQALGETDRLGNFTLPVVPAGPHQLRVSALGYEPAETTLTGRPAAAPGELAEVAHVTLVATSQFIPDVAVTATRANNRTATVYTDLGKQDLNKRNFGQDLPYLLDQTPSVVVTSDAGAGVGYTDIRIRGTSSTGINTTINGVPLNDPESHGSFLVNLPDLASSINSIQVQRGVGTSQNGSAAFGASLNISTLDNRREAYAETQNTYGSFNTWKNNVSFGTGLVGKYFTFDGRLSRIASDGYLNRAASDLKSYYFAAGFQVKSTRLKFITFSGREKTYQA